MGVKHKTVKNEFPNMRKQMELVNGEGIEVGVIRGEHKWLAPIHEYGLDIQVTPKMRVFLHRMGLHLKESTTHIHIPERSFLRTGYDENRDAVLKKARLMMADVTSGKMSADTLLEAVGMELADRIRDYAVELDSPPNHPFTVEQKGSSNPLIGGGSGGGGEMIREGIHWRKAK